MLALPTLSEPLSLAAWPTVSAIDHLQPPPLLQPVYQHSTLIPHEDIATNPSQDGMIPAGSSGAPPSIPLYQPGIFPSMGLPVPGPHQFPPFPPYAYNIPFPPVPPMANGYPPGHAQMPAPTYHPMMGYYLPGYRQHPPPSTQKS